MTRPYLGAFIVQRCPSHGTECRAQGATVGPWALIDPRDESHAYHADTKLEAQAYARTFRRTREEALRKEEEGRP